MFKSIMVPIDGSPLSMNAMRKAIALAPDCQARVTAMTVSEPYHVLSANPQQLEWTREQYDKHSHEKAEAILEEARKEARFRNVSCDAIEVVHDDPHAAIIESAANRACDLIAISSHGRHGFAALILGSVTLKVLTHSTIPVLVYR